MARGPAARRRGQTEARGRSLAAQGPRGRGSRLGPSRALAGGGGGGVGGSRAANGRAPLEQLQRAGARPRWRRGGGARREARLAEEKRRPGPGRAPNSGGGTMEAAAAAPRRRQLLIVLVAAAATLLPGAKGAWLPGGCGAREPGRASGSLQLFLKHGAGPGAQVAAPGRPGFPDPAGATRAGAGRRGGAGAVSRAGGRAPNRGRRSWALRGSGWRACRGRGLPSGVRGWAGPWSSDFTAEVRPGLRLLGCGRAPARRRFGARRVEGSPEGRKGRRGQRPRVGRTAVECRRPPRATFLPPGALCEKQARRCAECSPFVRLGRVQSPEGCRLSC